MTRPHVPADVRRRSCYEPAEFDAICSGGHLPNAEEVSPSAMLNTIAAHQFVERRGNAAHPSGDKSWAHFFLISGQGGGLTGEGYAIVYNGAWTKDGPVGGKAYRFAICKHEKLSTGSAMENRRGWHPGYCRLCGLDMTIDSGD
jgi:hypothetical protein